MTNDEFTAFVLAGAEEMERKTAHLARPIASVHYSRDGKALDVCLDTAQDTYSDWIAGEGADVGLHRIQETKRLNGAHFACYAKTLVVGGDFGTITIDLESGKVEVEPAEEFPTPTQADIDSAVERLSALGKKS